ncbi:MAG: ATP-binding cassette domain-containing protein, partial [Pontimonas sp.]
ADRDITLAVVDHDAARWAGMVDRVITLEAGRIVPSASTPQPPTPLTTTPHRGSQKRGEEVLCASELVISRDASRALGEPLNLSIRAGEIVALRGPNGSGKTTLAMTLAGLLRPLGGFVTIFGTDPGSQSSRALCEVVGVVPQNPAHSFFHSSVRDELGAGRAEEVATRWGLTGVLDQHPLTLSGGQQRRLALALATGQEQRLLVLDEPSQSLDRAGREHLVASLRDAAESGLSVVLATHDDALVDEMGAREIVLPSSPARQAPALPTGVLEKVNPLALLGAALIPAIALLSTIDLVSAGVAVAFVLAGLPLVARGVSRLGLRMLPVVLASGFSAITIALYGESSGAMFFEWGLIQVSEGSLALALATALRIIAIGAPAVLLFSQVDATRFADSLAQQARAPENFVVGGLAGLRLLDVVAGDREVREWMVRSRGRGDRGVLRRVASVAFTTFVLAIRRSHTLAMAMEARAFGLHSSRTHFRTSLFPGRDYLWIAGGAVVGALSVGAALLTGQFNAILG